METELMSIDAQHTPEQLAEIAASLGLSSAKDLQSPPRRDFRDGMGYTVKVISAEFQSDEKGDSAKLVLMALDANNAPVKGVKSTLFLTFPWETESFKFRDIDARVRATNDFKSMLLVAKPEARLVKRIEAAGVISYYDAKSDAKLDAKIVKAAYENEDLNVSIIGRTMQKAQDVSPFANLVFKAVYHTYESKDGVKRGRFQRFSAEEQNSVTYLNDPKEMFSRGAGEAEGSPMAAHSDEVF